MATRPTPLRSASPITAATDTAGGYTGDNLTNLVTSMGTSRDKLHGTHYDANERTPVSELESMYGGEWLAAAAVDIIPEDMVREWREFDGLEAGQVDILQDAERRFRVEEKVAAALKWARLYGGCAVIMMIDGAGEFHEPLDYDRVKPGALKRLQVVDRYWMFPDMTTLWDPLSEHFGEPQHYRVFSGADMIHRDRILRFEGVKLPLRMMVQEQWWGASVIDRVKESLFNAIATQNGIAALIQEAKVDVYGIQNLFSLLGDPATTKQVMDRIALAQVGKSIHNAILIDAAGETYEQKQINLNTGLQQLLEEFLSIFAAAVDIPVTRLLGESAKGLSATGEGDLRNYYDSVAAKRKLQLTPQLRQLDEVLLRAEGLPLDTYSFKWPPLWQETKMEAASVGLSEAQEADHLVGMGAIEPRHVTARLEKSGRYDIEPEYLEQVSSEPPRPGGPDPDPLGAGGSPGPPFAG